MRAPAACSCLENLSFSCSLPICMHCSLSFCFSARIPLTTPSACLSRLKASSTLSSPRWGPAGLSVAAGGAVEDGWPESRLTTLLGEPLRGGSGLPEADLSAGTLFDRPVARVLLPVFGLALGEAAALPRILAGEPGTDACGVGHAWVRERERVVEGSMRVHPHHGSVFTEQSWF